jgi:hypothetical protein
MASKINPGLICIGVKKLLCKFFYGTICFEGKKVKKKKMLEIDE